MDRPIDMHSRRQTRGGGALWAAPLRMIQSLMKWRGRRRALQELMALDDHLLKDIGFRRDEVLKALHTGGLPKRIDWRDERAPETSQESKTRCPCKAMTARRSCPM